MHIVALVQARMSSSRLPGKVLAPIDGMPMVLYMLRRLRACRSLADSLVVTSTDASDDALAEALGAVGLPVFRGSLDDVLDRYRQAAAAARADVVVRLTGDCPLIDPGIVDETIALHLSSGADYTSNVDPPTFPDGLDVEVFGRELLERAHAQARRGLEREHVTLWMRSAAAGARRANLRALADLSALRLTVDHADDLELVRRIATRLSSTPGFDLYDILRLLAREPTWLSINDHQRNEGLAKSLAAEAEGPA